MIKQYDEIVNVKDRIAVSKDSFSGDLATAENVGKLHQVFLNLFTNAIQAIDNKGTISIRTKAKTETIIVEITDTGCGISKENLPKITDPFFTTKDPGQGTGLGLSIAYTIILEHNGELDFESEVGKGTTAIIKLPIKPIS